MPILDHTGRVIQTSGQESPPKNEGGGPRFQPNGNQGRRRPTPAQLQAFIMKAKWDAAQTSTGNENHWANADNLDPHQAASERVRRTMRSRSRYEICENNPFLKGTLLTLTNDFVGRGAKLQLTLPRSDRKKTETKVKALAKMPEVKPKGLTKVQQVAKDRAAKIEADWELWCKSCRIRQKIWRMKLAKMVDGESFMVAYRHLGRRPVAGVELNFRVIETDQVYNPAEGLIGQNGYYEMDGIRFDQYENILKYYILKMHPGSGMQALSGKDPGNWYDAKYVIQWFRQDRGWLRGIPELAASLPLCAILRRYTMAVLRHAETAADFTAVIETEGPGATNPWTDGAGNTLIDDPFDIFPFEMGMIANLPWGYKLKQLQAVPLGHQYDEYVGALLREIARPILVPYNIVAGSSKDANMSSSVVDSQIYIGGVKSDRTLCEEEVLDKIFGLWWEEYSLANSGYGKPEEPPIHTWRWDKVGLDHTDPMKVATAIQILHENKFITDRDIQEGYYNRDVEDWRAEVEEDEDFRQNLPSVTAERELATKVAESKIQNPGQPGGKTSPPKKKVAARWESNGHYDEEN